MKQTVQLERIAREGYLQQRKERKKKYKRKHRSSTKSALSKPSVPPTLRWNLLNKYSHDRSAFTQGLEFSRPESNNPVVPQTFYETTGLYGGRSTLRRVDVLTGKVLQSIGLGNDFFGEGMTIVNGKIYVLTWRSRTGFVFDLKSFEKLSTFTFKTLRGEGWGLTHDFQRKELIVSDGSDYLFFWDMNTLSELRRVRVQSDKAYVRKINELEYISVPVQGRNEKYRKGIVLANIWYSDTVIAIDPDTGLSSHTMILANF